VPKARFADPDRLPPSWERLKRAAEQSKVWLDLVYVFEGGEKTKLEEVEEHIRGVKEQKGSDRAMVVIDDSQRLAGPYQPFETRLPMVAEQLQGLAVRSHAPVLATWPELRGRGDAYPSHPQEWEERVASADVVLVMENDPERTKKLTEPNRAVNLHIVKNRGGERGTLSFDFSPPFSQFRETNQDAGPQ
jgi:replicative DNA helicase